MIESIGVRLKKLIDELGIKKVTFAEKIKVDQSYVTQMIKGRNVPSKRVIDSICREYHVNEAWLRTGEEPMFIEPASFDLSEFAKNNGATELELNFMKAYFGLPPEVREKLIAYFKDSLTDDTSKVSVDIKPSDIPSTLNVNGTTKLDAKEVTAYTDGDIDIDAEVAAYQQELEIQKKARENLLVSDGSNSGTAQIV